MAKYCCLEKDRADRWQSALDMNEALKWIRDGSVPVAGPAGAAVVTAPKSSWKRKLAFSAVGLAAWAVTAFVIWSFRPATPARIARLAIPLPPNQRIAPQPNPFVAISPDGMKIVYVASQAGTQQLYLRPIDSLEASPVPGTVGGINPFFSPDGQWIGFFQENKLKKVPISGGQPNALATAVNNRGAIWTADGMITYSPGSDGAIFQVSENGGTAKAITQPDASQGQNSDRWPDLLPGGKAVVLTAGTTSSGWLGAKIVVQSLGTTERKVVIDGATEARYVPTGHLIYARSGTLMAVPFNLQRLELSGAPVPVVEGVMQSTSTGAAQYSVSDNGTLIYFPGSASTERTLAWVDRKGVEQPLPAPPRAYRNQRLSPDGRQILLAIEGIQSDLWVYDIPRNTLTRLTFEGNNSYPILTPDGKRITYSSIRDGVKKAMPKQ